MKLVPRILVIEDDPRTRRILLQGLPPMGVEVHVEAQLAHGRSALASGFDLVILDLGLPDGEGLDLCRELRARQKDIPILILTARGTPEERIRGLDVGADDYLVKPFHLGELQARIRGVLRRSGRGFEERKLAAGELWLDPATRSAGVLDRALELKPREFELLLFFMSNPQRTWTREQLLERVWGAEFDGGARTVDLHVTRLRAAIETNPRDPRYIETVWGVGYRFREPDAHG
jgi:DNA-binding response OmpR family regulator